MSILNYDDAYLFTPNPERLTRTDNYVDKSGKPIGDRRYANKLRQPTSGAVSQLQPYQNLSNLAPLYPGVQPVGIVGATGAGNWLQYPTPNAGVGHAGLPLVAQDNPAAGAVRWGAEAVRQWLLGQRLFGAANSPFPTVGQS